MHSCSLSKISLIFCGILSGLAATGCHPQGGPPPAMPPPQVTVAQVDSVEWTEWKPFTGRIEAKELVEIRPRVSGYIEKIHFQAGQWVRKGDLLVTIDPRWHQAELEIKEADASRARVALENAKREADRSIGLLESKAISKEEAEGRVAKFEEAQAAQVSADASRKLARLDLDYTRIVAPVDGRISRALVTEGNFVSGIPSANTVLATLVSQNPIHVYSDMDEETYLQFERLRQDGKIQLNADGKIPVEIQLAGEEDYSHKGFIESFDNRLNPDTGSILFRSTFENADGTLVPGLFVRVRVPVGARKSVIMIDERAIGTDLAKKYVLVVTPDQKAEYQAVELGPVVEGRRVVLSGLKAGDRIIVNGLQRVRPGMPVVPEGEGAEKKPSPSQSETPSQS